MRGESRLGSEYSAGHHSMHLGFTLLRDMQRLLELAQAE